jgi:predicted ATPase
VYGGAGILGRPSDAGRPTQYAGRFGAKGDEAMIAKLTLNNFRCFRDFVLEGVRQVTLIAGENGVGKSTILESIFLFNDRNSHDVFIKLNNIRGITQDRLSAAMVWEHFFACSDVNNTIKISVTTENQEEQCLTLEKDASFSLYTSHEIKSHAHIIGMPAPDAYSLKISYTDSVRSDALNFTVAGNNQIAVTMQNPVLFPAFYTHYICSKVTFTTQYVSEWFGKILKGKQLSQCIDILRTLDARITNIFALPQGGVSTLFASFGSASELPINILGDGINKLINIILIMLSHCGATILIDEIENGFHYSFFPKLWEIIGRLAAETKCQVIATSHSYECIRGARCLAADGDTPDLFRFVRLDRQNDAIVPKKYENEQFVYAIDNNWEIR